MENIYKYHASKPLHESFAIHELLLYINQKNCKYFFDEPISTKNFCLIIKPKIDDLDLWLKWYFEFFILRGLARQSLSIIHYKNCTIAYFPEPGKENPDDIYNNIREQGGISDIFDRDELNDPDHVELFDHEKSSNSRNLLNDDDSLEEDEHNENDVDFENLNDEIHFWNKSPDYYCNEMWPYDNTFKWPNINSLPFNFRWHVTKKEYKSFPKI